MNFTEDVTSGQEGLLWLDRILEIDATLSVVMITAYGDIELAVQAIKQGACDFIVKPWQNEKLLATASAAMSLSRSRRETQTLRSRQQQLSADLDQPYQDFVGDAPLIRQVREVIDKVATTDANVLITGEHGTGKDVVARALHGVSPRAEGPLVIVNLGGLSDGVFASELFGHVKGAFTDAKADRVGRFEMADQATLFLDEIANVPLQQQAKLLRVLENREIQRVGSSKTRRVDVRVVSATNANLGEAVANGDFREDLLYRLNTVEIHLPPLRERTEDIPLLARYFLGKQAARYGRDIEDFSTAAMTAMREHTWPGNVRELQHAVERSVLMARGSRIETSDLGLRRRDDGSVLMDQLTLDEAERLMIEKALERYQGNVSKAAEALGLSRSALYRRLQRHEGDGPDGEEG